MSLLWRWHILNSHNHTTLFNGFEIEPFRLRVYVIQSPWKFHNRLVGFSLIHSHCYIIQPRRTHTHKYEKKTMNGWCKSPCSVQRSLKTHFTLFVLLLTSGALFIHLFYALYVYGFFFTFTLTLAAFNLISIYTLRYVTLIFFPLHFFDSFNWERHSENACKYCLVVSKTKQYCVCVREAYGII